MGDLCLSSCTSLSAVQLQRPCGLICWKPGWEPALCFPLLKVTATPLRKTLLPARAVPLSAHLAVPPHLPVLPGAQGLPGASCRCMVSGHCAFCDAGWLPPLPRKREEAIEREDPCRQASQPACKCLAWAACAALQLVCVLRCCLEAIGDVQARLRCKHCGLD